MGAPYDISLSRTDAESISFAVYFLDADGPFSVEGLTFEYVIDGRGDRTTLTSGDGITLSEDNTSITIALPVTQRLRKGDYDHGLRATDADDFTQQIFYGTVSVSNGGGFSS